MTTVELGSRDVIEHLVLTDLAIDESETLLLIDAQFQRSM